MGDRKIEKVIRDHISVIDQSHAFTGCGGINAENLHLQIPITKFSFPLTLPLSPEACLREAASAKAGERDEVRVRI
jgi:hypothetical protein